MGCAARLPTLGGLPFPARPAVTWYTGTDGGFCLTLDDANRLLHFDDQLRAFESAWRRLAVP